MPAISCDISQFIFITKTCLFKGLAWESLTAKYPFDKKYPPYFDDRQLGTDVLQDVLEESLLWPDPKDGQIKLSIEEKCAAYVLRL